MRWNAEPAPEKGATRIKRRPKRLSGQWRWLEFAAWVQQYRPKTPTSHVLIWVDSHWSND